MVLTSGQGNKGEVVVADSSQEIGKTIWVTSAQVGSGATNEGFILNILKTPFLCYPEYFSTLENTLEMHFQRRYKIFICLVILRELESLRNHKCFSIIFPKILDAI